MDINSILEDNKFQYDEILKKSKIVLKNFYEFDINVIIGFRGRKEFIQPIIDSFTKAFNYYGSKDSSKKFCLTFVEHNESSEHENLILGQANYLWTPGNIQEQYSRSFAYNFGVKYSNKSKYYILHDLDILVKENFFEEVYKNLKSQCLQPYGKRRVLYMSQKLTNDFLLNSIDYNKLDENSPEISLPAILGSKGGSILVERDLYYMVGGFDPEIFWGYAPEDQLFWDKIQTVLGEIDYADNPPINIFHMWHPPTLHYSNNRHDVMEKSFYEFRSMTKKNRLNFIQKKQELFKDDGNFIENLSTSNNKKAYIFTEIYQCGKILNTCLTSFFKFHPNLKVHVFGMPSDFKEVGKFNNVEYIELSSDSELQDCFKHGHMGTAHIGARVITEFSEGYDYIIHFDSDVIFKKESISLLTEKIQEGYDLIGPRRCYKKNMNGVKNLSGLSDVSQTYFYAFNKTKIGKYDFSVLRQMIVGYHNPLGHAILDYFDPVSFEILKNGGKIYFLNVDDVGGLTEFGNRENKYLELNNELDFGNNIVHWGGIGSGQSFVKNGNGSVPESYTSWAKKRYAMYSKIIHNITIPNIEIDENLLKKINAALNETNNQ